MGLAIHLLGPPRVERDGNPAGAPRGHKPWALLAYLLRADAPTSRERLASLLFSDAEDPLAALRWNLSALRRLLGQAEALQGDPVRLALPPDTYVDVDVIASGSWAEALRVPSLGRGLLEGMSFATNPAFELWLAMERRHLEGITESVLHEAAQARLGSGDAEGAADLAARLVQINPLEENFHVLLVRSLAASGEGVEAARQVARCRELLERELGTEPSPALDEASRTVTAAPTAGPGKGRHAARAQLEAGEAAISAGAIDAGLHCLRRAVADGRTLRDPQLLARALVALGSALVHAARGRDEEAGAALHEALVFADEERLDVVGAAAARELGYVEFLRGRYPRAEAWFAHAAELAGDDDHERAAIGNFLGAVLTDTGRTGAAISELRVAVERAERAAAPKLVSFGLAMLGRAHFLRHELDDARRALARSLEIAEHEWTSFVPFPLTLAADAELAAGNTDTASEGYERAFALGCQLGDPCWEGLAARGIGLVAAERGDVPTAVDWLESAQARCMRLPDAWVWAKAYVLEALCALAVDHGLPRAPAWIQELEEVAGRAGMRELTVRAYLHRACLGVEGAAEAADALAADLDNPALTVRLVRDPA